MNMPNQRILFFDFESYYDNEYSLTKMAPPNYILDPRFETIGCSFKEGDAPATYIDAPDIGEFLKGYDPEKTTTVAFNALFDNCILAWRYGFVPRRMVCTMRLAVSLRGHLLQSNSLASVGKLLGVGTKGTVIESARGKHRSDIIADPEFYEAYQAYANNDCEMNHDIFWKLLPEFPSSERRVMDRVLRCAVEPVFVCDTNMLTDHLDDLATDKVKMLRLCMGAKEEDLDNETMFPPGAQDDAAMEKFKTSLRSNGQFEALLKAHGIDIEYKTSPTTGLGIPAFAKTDDFMANLLENPDPVVAALAVARLDLRSTIEETRGARILSMANLDWPAFGYRGGSLPIPLKYAGAHTHRLSGDWSLNMQNLPAGRGTNTSKLRKALKAPDGYKVVVADKSQIECRINAWLCGQHDLLALFAKGGDPYSVLASYIFGFPVDKKVHLTERFIGKTGELGLGFRCGGPKFFNQVVRKARELGMDMKELLKVWTPELAQKAVDTYRESHAAIRNTWPYLDNVLRGSWIGQEPPIKWGPVIIGNEAGCGYVEGPGGLRMNYANPREEEDDKWGTQMWYDYGKRRHMIHGGVFLENIVQFLARIDTMHDALRISDRGYRFVLQSHDELAWIVPDAQAEECAQVALEEMRRPPSWGQSIPLNAECNHGQSYSDAK
jgi:DNA polymerase family A